MSLHQIIGAVLFHLNVLMALGGVTLLAGGELPAGLSCIAAGSIGGWVTRPSLWLPGRN